MLVSWAERVRDKRPSVRELLTSMEKVVRFLRDMELSQPLKRVVWRIA